MQISANNIISGAQSAAYAAASENETEYNTVRAMFEDFKKFEGGHERTMHLIDSVKRALCNSCYQADPKHV